MKKNYGALVVGAGIGGIRSALDLAETGQKVLLIDRRPHLGGLLTQLDHQFPSDHCGMCKMLPLTERDSSSEFCLRKGLFHKNIDIHLSTELTHMEGDPGKFRVTLTKKSSFVDPNKCIGCGECAKVCPVSVPSEFNAGLTTRAAVHLPVPHMIPNHYVVDLDACKRCWQCHETCPTGAIDFRLDQRKDFPILVADKDPQTLENLKEWLGDLNFPLSGAANGVEALNAIGEREDIRLLLLDLDMEDMDPERVVTRALELRPEITVVVMAGDATHEKAVELMGLGARDVIMKPLKKRVVPWLDKLYMRINSDEAIEAEVAAVVLAAGFDCYDPADPVHGMADVLGYGYYPNVVTSVEFERMISGTGPDRPRNGQILMPGQGRPVKRIAWVQCVGSRDRAKKADYCSSICCMISLKEANLAKKITRGEVEASIFFMDMRTFGKGFDKYKEVSVRENNIRLIPSRIHSILPDTDAADGSLIMEYMDAEGNKAKNSFDLVVLAVGARPPKSMPALAKTTDLETNEWGFAQPRPFAPARTSQLGVFAAGAFNAPRDIAESVVQSSAAALGASRLINIYAPLKEQVPDPEPEYRDVRMEAPKLLVALCTSCPVLERKVDIEALIERLSTIDTVAKVVQVSSACSSTGWDEIKAAAEETMPNRVLIGACQPYAYVPKLRELGIIIGLNPALMDVADIYTDVMTLPAEEEKGELDDERLNAKIFSALSMSVVKLLGADASPRRPDSQVSRDALIIGGGLAGMTAAMGIADHGFDVHLIEEEEQLGGTAMKLHYTLEGDDPRHYMEDLIEQVMKHPNIKVHTDARVALSMGRAGRFMSVISTDEGSMPLQHGATILATGGHEAKVYEYGNRVHKTVLTQLELEEKLATGKLDTAELAGVAMIQCWRSRDGNRDYCSRVCCAGALKNALMLKSKNPDLPVYIFYRDIMTYGFSEKYYTQARKAGAIFIRYDLEHKPDVAFEDGKPVITAFDHILQRPVTVRVDMLALSSGIEPNDAGELAEMFGVELDDNGFFQEAESKWRPVDFMKQGVFMCGLARAPGNMNETIASAKAAAQRAMRVLSEKRLVSGNAVAQVRESLCSLCGRCIEVCPYEARSMDLDHERIIVDEFLCQGCGSCAAVCPNSASVLRGFTDSQVMNEIDAALGELV